jgi:outer membrane protein OmpA-like peptidoglycan-associated protein
MDIHNKILRLPAPGTNRNRSVGIALLSMLTLLAPTWVEADSTASPISMAAVDSTINMNGVAPQAMAMAPHEMRFIGLGRVTFVSNKWVLSDTAKRQLDGIAAYLLANPGAERLLLEGHTDWVGGAKFNDTLSDKRALAVSDYLVSKGIAPELILWKGRGKHAPVDENWTRLGRVRNRQVELYAIYLPHP